MVSNRKKFQNRKNKPKWIRFMLLKEKLKQESPERIFLYREGLFWKMYNISAFNFIRKVKVYAVKKKYVKEVKVVVASIGFPDAILKDNLERLKPLSKAINVSEKVIEIELNESVEGYQDWFDQTAVEKNEIRVITEKEPEKLNEECVRGEDILRELRDFPIMQKTPMEVQMFVVELQGKLKTL